MNMNKNSATSSNFEISLQDEIQQDIARDHFGRLVAKSLDQNLESLPTHINQRLEQARTLAISKKKPEKSYAWNFSLNFAGNSNSSKGSQSSQSNWWRNIGNILPIIVLLVALIGIAQWQQDARIDDIADLDAALLSDEMPPDAYADNGFWIFLKTLTNQDSESDNNASAESSLTGR
jgi:hypothetical protein